MKEAELYKFLQSKIPDVQMMKYKYSYFDCISHSKKYLIELKCRKTHYDKLLIERSKYDKMIETSNQLNYKPAYVNSTPNGIFWFWLSAEPQWEKRQMPESTDFNRNDVIDKEVGYLHIKDSVVINKVRT
jgi:hypothetical protein